MVDVDVNKYVVLDVETNGLNSTYDDLLSISIYEPSTNRIYNRFLPLELNENVWTTDINGITEEMLKDKHPIDQEEFDKLVNDFKLNEKTILTYGRIDKTFINTYCKRHKITGFNKLTFYNFKHQIISSSFSSGIVTKDNLCKLFGIDNVQKVHSGVNDCLLEWKLFKELNNNYLIVTGTNVFELNDDYIVPVSYLQSYNNFKFYREIPKVFIKTRTIRKFDINKKKITRFDTNVSGISIEHLINTMLNATEIDSLDFELRNKKKLKYIGSLPSPFNQIPITFNKDGTISSVLKKDEEYIESVNKSTKQLKKQLDPLIEYIKTKIFKNESILSQELIVDKKTNVFSKCDLSNKNAILEIKTNYSLDFEKIKLQLYYESNGRTTYVLHFDWKCSEFIITKVDFIDEEEYKEKKSKERIEKNTKLFQQKIDNQDILVLEYINSYYPIKLKCKKCNYEWETNYRSILNSPICPNCSTNEEKKLVRKRNRLRLKSKKLSIEEFCEGVAKNSNNSIKVEFYNISKAKVRCLNCDHNWEISTDYLLESYSCPKCTKKKL